MNFSRYFIPLINHTICTSIRRSFAMSNGPVGRLGKIAKHLGKNDGSPCKQMMFRSFCSNPTNLDGNVESKTQIKESKHNESNNKEEKYTYKAISMPNDSWSEDLLKHYKELCRQVDESNGLWETLVLYESCTSNKYKLFNACIDENGERLFERFCIINRKEKLFKGVFQFGPWTMGPEGYVHGGAIATVLDIVTAGLPNRIGLSSVTANLNVDFMRSIPVGSTVLAYAKIESVEGKKIAVYGELRSSDGSQSVYAKAKTLCVIVKTDKT